MENHQSSIRQQERASQDGVWAPRQKQTSQARFNKSRLTLFQDKLFAKWSECFEDAGAQVVLTTLTAFSSL